MADDGLAGKKILIVEDEWFIAQDIEEAVRRAGGEPIGPVASNAEALSLLADATIRPDAATLNIRIADGLSYPTADALVAIGAPVLFVSATEQGSLPARFGRTALLTKPVTATRVIHALIALV